MSNAQALRRTGGPAVPDGSPGKGPWFADITEASASAPEVRNLEP
jgi:hypothetical protein